MSSVYTRPSYQTSLISTYFTNAAADGHTPSSGYGSGRGIPDISALANYYSVAIGQNFYFVSGTSASTPVIAGIISLANSARLEAGNSTMGWLMPFLYTYQSNFVTDITSGNNKCTASSSHCCTQGFYAATGWDPTTGLGVLQVDKFLQTVAPTRAPTIQMHSPTISPAPSSKSPSMIPTAPPSSSSGFTTGINSIIKSVFITAFITILLS